MMAIGYLKSLKQLFKSPKKIKEEFDTMLTKQFQENGVEVTQISYSITVFCLVILSIFYFVMTASVVGSMIMTVVASLIIVRQIFSGWQLMCYVTGNKKDLNVGYFNKLLDVVGIGYLIAFFILIFI
jgi:hypothetical protein